jgi:hypothetical protein
LRGIGAFRDMPVYNIPSIEDRHAPLANAR